MVTAIQHLKHAGLVAATTPGTWGLTPEGQAYVAARPAGLSEADTFVLNRATGASPRPVRDDDASPGVPPPPDPTVTPLDDTSTPEEQIERALVRLRDSIAEQLLERFLAGTPCTVAS